MLAATGVLTAATGYTALLLMPAFVLGVLGVLGVLAGTRLFSRFSDQRFRQLTLLLMCGVALGVLLV